MISIQSFFDEKSYLINLIDIEIKKIDELEWIATQLENNDQLKFINWKTNESFLNENKEIKSRIQNHLISNILGGKNNELVIDLSEYDIDHDFLIRLAHSMCEKPGRVGKVILGKRNEALFGDSECWSQIRSILSNNNNNFRRYPSDAVHCMLASYSQHVSDSDLWSKQSGWIIENEIKIPDHDYHSILFRNNSTRHLVLAFRGLRFYFNECFWMNPKEKEFKTRMSQKLSIHCYYAYLHTNSSFELSEKMSFWLSFTGHAFGAWLAELAVFYCYQKSGTSRIRAVTFDSPGSGEIFYRLDDTEDFNESLDITTYLSCPNLVNTCSADHMSIYNAEYAHFTKPTHHLGTVYFINDLYTERSSLSDKIKISKELKDFSEELIKKGENDELLKLKLEELIRQENRFYLEGLRCLFSENNNLKRMLEYIETVKTENGVNLKRVQIWPKIKNEIYEKLNIYPSINYRELLEKVHPTGLISAQIINESTSEKLYSDIIKIVEVKMNCIVTTLSVLENLRNYSPDNNILNLEFIFKDEEFLFKEEKFLCAENLFKNSENKVYFWPSYQIQEVNYRLDLLRNDEIDSKLARFYFEKYHTALSTELCDEFNQLKDLMEIEIKFDGSKYDRRIKSTQIEINRLRDRFVRLDEMLEIIQDEKIVKDEIFENIEENWKSLETFIEPEKNIFEKIEKFFEENKTVYIHGLSGCGKTTLAREYALYRKSKHQNLSTVFVNSGIFEDNVYELKERFLKSRDDAVLKLDEILQLIELNISGSKNEILFIFDNIKDFKEVIELVCLIDSRHKILITSENSDITSVSGNAIIELKTFNSEKCEEYLGKNGIDLSTKIVEKFLEKGNLSAQLMELFVLELKNNLINLHEIKFEEETRKNQIKYILNRIKENDCLALEILKHLSILNGRHIELELIEEIFLSEKNLKTSLDYLTSIGYVKKIENKFYKMSKQIQNDVRAILENEEESIALRIIQTFSRIIMKNKNLSLKIQIEKVEKLIQHIEKLFNEKKQFQINLIYNAIKLIKKVKKLIDQSSYKLEKSIKIVIKIMENFSGRLKIDCEIIKSKADLERKLGKYDEALESFEKILNIQQKENFLPNFKNHSDIAKSYNSIGSVLTSKGEYYKAIEYYRKSLEIQKKVLPENHPTIASCYNNIIILDLSIIN